MFTGIAVGILYIAFNIIIPSASYPVVSYMNFVDYSDNAGDIAKEFKEILSNDTVRTDLAGYASAEDKQEALDKIEKEVDENIQVSLRNMKYNNYKKLIEIIDDIISYRDLDKLTIILEEAGDLDRIITDIKDIRTNEKVIKGIQDHIGEIEAKIYDVTGDSSNNMSNSNDIIFKDNIFDIDGSIIDDLFNKALEDLITEMESAKAEISSNNIILQSDIDILKNMKNPSNNIGSISSINNRIEDWEKKIKIRKNSYNKANPDDPLNINVDRIMASRVKNLLALNTIKYKLLEIRNLIANSYIYEVYLKLNVNKLVDGIAIIKKVYTYNNTDSILTMLMKYSDDERKSLDKIEALNKNEEKKAELEKIIGDFEDLESNYIVEPDYDIKGSIYSLFTDDLKKDFKDALTTSISKLKDSVIKRENYDLFNEMLISIPVKIRERLVSENEILSDIVGEAMAYRPEYPYLPEKKYDSTNKMFEVSIEESIKAQLTKDVPRFPKKRIVFISENFIEKIRQSSVDNMEQLVAELEIIRSLKRVVTPVYSEDYKEMLAKNNDFNMPDELKQKIIKFINPILYNELENTMSLIENALSNYIPFDNIYEIDDGNIVNKFGDIVTNPDLISVSDKIIDLADNKDIEIRRTAMFGPNKISAVESSSTQVQAEVINAYNAFGNNPFNIAVGFIISVFVWPLFSILLVSGGSLASYMTFIMFNPTLMIILMILGIITLLVPFISILLFSKKSTSNDE